MFSLSLLKVDECDVIPLGETRPSRRGAHVRIHNNSTRFKELKPGTRLGNVRVDRWE